MKAHSGGSVARLDFGDPVGDCELVLRIVAVDDGWEASLDYTKPREETWAKVWSRDRWDALNGILHYATQV